MTHETKRPERRLVGAHRWQSRLEILSDILLNLLVNEDDMERRQQLVDALGISRELVRYRDTGGDDATEPR